MFKLEKNLKYTNQFADNGKEAILCLSLTLPLHHFCLCANGVCLC